MTNQAVLRRATQQGLLCGTAWFGTAKYWFYKLCRAEFSKHFLSSAQHGTAYKVDLIRTQIPLWSISGNFRRSRHDHFQHFMVLKKLLEFSTFFFLLLDYLDELVTAIYWYFNQWISENNLYFIFAGKVVTAASMDRNNGQRENKNIILTLSEGDKNIKVKLIILLYKNWDWNAFSS